VSKYDVMVLAGRSNFRVTHQFYLAVGDDLVDRAGSTDAQAFGKNLARLARAPPEHRNKKGRQAEVLSSTQLTKRGRRN